jgi:hypothetical protein
LEWRKSPLELTKHATSGCQSIKGLFAGAAAFSVVQPLCGDPFEKDGSHDMEKVAHLNAERVLRL